MDDAQRKGRILAEIDALERKQARAIRELLASQSQKLQEIDAAILLLRQELNA